MKLNFLFLLFISFLICTTLVNAKSSDWKNYKESLQKDIQELENLKSKCGLCFGTLGKYCGNNGCKATDCIDACDADCSWKAVGDTFKIVDCERGCIKCVETLEKQQNTINDIIYSINHATKEELDKDYLEYEDYNNNKVITVLPGKIYRGSLPDGSHISIFGGKKGTNFVFLKEKYSLNFGHIWRSIKKLVKRQTDIYTPTAVTGVRGTEYLLNVELNGKTKLSVIEGTVEISNLMNKESMNITAGNSIEILPNGTMSSLQKINLEQLDRWWENNTTRKVYETQQQTSNQTLFLIIVGTLLIVVGIIFLIYRKRK